MDSTWKALADPVRRRILELLRDEPRTTGEICGSVAGLSRCSSVTISLGVSYGSCHQPQSSGWLVAAPQTGKRPIT